MADYYYNLDVYNARPQGEIAPAGVKDTVRSGATNWNFQFAAAGVADEAAGEAAFLAAYAAALPNAPGNIDLILASGAGSLYAALDTSATQANDGTATEGVWNERVGKGVYAYKIGVSATDAADAITNTVAHDLA
jgi:hypothetical protein